MKLRFIEPTQKRRLSHKTSKRSRGWRLTFPENQPEANPTTQPKNLGLMVGKTYLTQRDKVDI